MTMDPIRTGDIEEDVQVGEVVESSRRPSGTSLVAVRVPHDLLARISRYAETHGVTVSEVLRRGAERLVGGTFVFDAYYATGTTIYGRLVQPAPPASGSPSTLRETKRSPEATSSPLR